MTTTQAAIITTLQAGPLHPYTLFVQAGGRFETVNKSVDELIEAGQVIEVVSGNDVLLAINEQAISPSNLVA